MADIGQAVRSILVADAGVSAITTRVHSDYLPQGISLPAVVLWTISSVGVDSLVGFTGMEQSTIQLECLASTRTQSAALWKAVNQALSGYRGTSETVPIRSVSQATGRYDREDRPTTGSDQRRFVTAQDFSFSYHAYEV